MLENPGISNAQIYGYPEPDFPRLYHCEQCGREFQTGDDCWVIEGEMICERCLRNYKFEIGGNEYG